MQSKSFAFPHRRFVISLLFAFLIAAAFALVSKTAQAQTVAGYPTQGSSAITSVVSKSAGQAEITITGVALKSGLSYCLIGVGHGNWYGSATRVQLDKIGCAQPVGGKVVVPIRLESKRYEVNGATIGYVPIGVDAEGKIATWPPKPTGSLPFERSNGTKDDIVAVHWTAGGIAQLATAQQAMTIND